MTWLLGGGSAGVRVRVPREYSLDLRTGAGRSRSTPCAAR